MSEGFPSIVQSDNGKEFKNAVLQDWLKANNVISKFGRPRHPQSQGQVERANQTLVRRMSKCLDGSSVRWVDILGKNSIFYLFVDDVNFQYNCDVHRATKKIPLEVFRKRSVSINCKASFLQIEESGFEEVLDEDYQNQEDIHYVADFGTCNLQETISSVFSSTSGGNPSFLSSQTVPVSSPDFFSPRFSSSDSAFQQSSVSTPMMSAPVLASAASSPSVADSERFLVNPVHSRDYLNGMNKKLQVHGKKYKKGDLVYLAKDFDKNPQTIQKKLEGFFHKDPFTVLAVTEEGNVIIENSEKTRSEVVSSGRIKKVNEK